MNRFEEAGRHLWSLENVDPYEVQLRIVAEGVWIQYRDLRRVVTFHEIENAAINPLIEQIDRIVKSGEGHAEST